MMSVFKHNKTLVIGTLLLVGVFGVWNMTANVVLAADEVVVSENPVVETVVEETPAPAEEPAQTTDVVEDIVVEEEVVAEEPTEAPSDTPITEEVIEDVMDETDVVPALFIQEEVPADGGFVPSAEEFSSQPASGQIAISDEFGGDTQANNNNNQSNNPVAEDSFTTPGNTNGSSDEGFFVTDNDTGCTVNCGGGVDEVVSEEGYFNTLSDNTNPEVSVEGNFTTLSDIGCTTNCGTNGVSVEGEFTTLSDGGCTTNCGPSGVSGENQFTTLSDGGCTTNCGPDGVSDEYTFTTLSDGGCTTNCGPNGVSDEGSFTTEGDTGCTSNCGGGGGGGGGGSRPKPDPELPYACPILLTKFIRLGYDNDPSEVRKLQAFLIVFEGFTNLTVDGVYDYEDFLAVSEFQKRYGTDVLGPWGIADSTGYVYITTTYAINNIYCNRSTANNLDLRFYYGQGGVIERIESIDSTGATTTIYEKEARSNFAQLAAVGMFDFIRSWWCLLDILLLLIILALMAYGWWNESRERARLEKELGLHDETLAKMAAASAIPLAAVMDESDEEAEVIESPETEEDKETIYL